MIITIDSADSRPIYMQIADEVRRCIATGAIAVDDPLPSVRELAADLRINPNTVQQAYRELERLNVVYVKRGQGTFVSHEATRDATGERNRLASGVAARALQEAYRHGLSGHDLIDAIKDVTQRGEPVENEKE